MQVGLFLSQQALLEGTALHVEDLSPVGKRTGRLSVHR